MIFVWALLLAAAAIGNVDGAATDRQVSRIVGGEPVSIRDYSSAVQVEFGNSLNVWNQGCGGVIMSHRMVLSVAHCFDGLLFRIDQRRIRCGATYRNSGGYVIEIARTLIHPNYRPGQFEGDIIMLEMAIRLEWSEEVNRAFLPPLWYELFHSSPVTVVGWGTMRMDGSGPSSDVLRKADLKIVQEEDCVARYDSWPDKPAVISHTMLCVGTGELDACDGDDGSPVFFNKDILVGLVSWGHSCGSDYFPRVATRVSGYIGWLADNNGWGDW